MSPRLAMATALFLGLSGLLGLALRDGAADEPEPARQAQLVARGRYLTHHVAMCVECHTPRDAQGRLIEAEAFRGAPIPARTTIDGVEWALRAPNIAGLIGLTDEQEMQILTRGKAENRPAPKPPMPQFRMDADDARAIIAYLRTLE